MQQQVYLLILVACATSTMLISCGGGSKDVASTELPLVTTSKISPEIHINQLGFLPQDHKIAVVANRQQGSFNLLSEDTQQVVFKGSLSAKGDWPLSGENVSLADFSSHKQTGKYRLELEDGSQSVPFAINQNVYSQIHDASLKAYYFNRASTDLPEQYAGQWARAAGHPDEQVMVHSSAASKDRPEGTVISAPKGWYDAGDYGKYVVNSGISTYTLLLAYRQHKDFYQARSGHIPESNDQVPDILNEIMWNLDWLQAMQDPNDGGVYHKLTTLKFTGNVMPDKTHEQRYVVQKSTAAALNFAAVMAFASQIYADFETVYPGKSAEYQQAALSAWRWAKANPEQIYQQPQDVKTGAYGDKHLADEFAFAAAQLFLLTKDQSYLDEFNTLAQPLTVPNWASTAALGYYSLLSLGKSQLAPTLYEKYSQQLVEQALLMLEQQVQSAYLLPLIESDFVWGSNAVAMNKAMLLLIANQLKPQQEFRDAAVALTDYVLGRNPTGYAYVTGFGSKSPQHIHHRPSEADGVVEPVPGFVAGGAQNGWQDKCVYPSKYPAASYVDDYCSYSTNEIAINWNAPLVYVLAGLQAY
ncbi:glycoside hydrolase family 9 protein [Paraglaciecola hydrolytica]|uniref:Endoglucanase n=1 Tax=Paraglaciecola hydrolytica TaxID=1799789 RepID=A0A148KLF0_9ALTE|nr:glycoside hydrolase family 9 protein [Paraglaciecola hydrolytica]KXI27078.1 cellulase [Paraglaciecola hydrolytica]